MGVPAWPAHGMARMLAECNAQLHLQNGNFPSLLSTRPRYARAETRRSSIASIQRSRAGAIAQRMAAQDNKTERRDHGYLNYHRIDRQLRLVGEGNQGKPTCRTELQRSRRAYMYHTVPNTTVCKIRFHDLLHFLSTCGVLHRIRHQQQRNTHHPFIVQPIRRIWSGMSLCFFSFDRRSMHLRYMYRNTGQGMGIGRAGHCGGV